MFAFANWSSTGTHYQVHYFSDVALPQLHSNSVTAISFTTGMWTSDISPMSMLSLTAEWVIEDFVLRKVILHAQEYAGCHTAAGL
jgi:hypothetical protein